MSSPLDLIVGLGNPGSQYQATRHNAGFWFIDEICQAHRLNLREESKFKGQVAQLTVEDRRVWLLKPQTYMNHSGRAVAAITQFYKIPVERVLVVHDELDLAPGIARLKTGGGHGGHNGLRDIIAQTGSRDFQRLRLGIGHPGDSSQVVNYVLNKPIEDERISIDQAVQSALNCLPLIVNGNSQRAMNQLHSQ